MEVYDDRLGPVKRITSVALDSPRYNSEWSPSPGRYLALSNLQYVERVWRNSHDDL